MRRAGVLLIVAFLAGLVELSLAVLPRIGGDRLAAIIYSAPAVTRAQYDDYLETREPVYGWPKRPSAARGRTLPRPSPAYPDAGRWCVTLYGDSMTYAEEVGDEDAWGNLLARRLECPVGNFGAGGHGTDQALLRFLGNREDEAPVTVVGIFADNPMRNVNQYRYFITGGEALGLKPRFVLENGKLELIPLPKLTYDQFLDAIEDPGVAFPHEEFLPGSFSGPAVWSFPYLWSAVRAIRRSATIDYLMGRPRWVGFYEPGSASRALAITAGIAEMFREQAVPGKSIVAVVFPDRFSYTAARESGESPLRPLIAELERRRLPTLDLTDDFERHLRERSFCELLSRSNCTGHFNAAGNRVMAEAVHRFLIAEGLVASGEQAAKRSPDALRGGRGEPK